MEDKLDAGSSTDALIPPKLGYTWVIRPGAFNQGVGRWVDPATGYDAYPSSQWPQPEYSTDWNAAMQLYELIAEKGCLIWLRNLSSYDCGHECRILPGKNGDKMNELSKAAPTGQMAVCLAFLALPDSVVRP